MLGWSINLFRVFGIQLALHVSFVVLLGYCGYDGWREDGITGLFWNVGLLGLFFGCVVLHELGHSLTARRFGVRVSRILLLPIGGMAEFDRIPRKPTEELLITVAGPAVNFLIVVVLLPFAWRILVTNEEVPIYSIASLVGQLFLGNLWMGTFNLLPVFPMDGGRIFRALLAMKIPYLRATYWAMIAGKILALSLAVVVALQLDGESDDFNRIMKCALFLFIFWAGNAEYKNTLKREEAIRLNLIGASQQIARSDSGKAPIAVSTALVEDSK